MVTEKDLKIGVEWSYKYSKYRFITNPKNGYIEFINLISGYTYKQYNVQNLLNGFNSKTYSKTYILCKPIEKIYELW
jgi:hypothetical protein